MPVYRWGRLAAELASKHGPFFPGTPIQNLRTSPPGISRNSILRMSARSKVLSLCQPDRER